MVNTVNKITRHTALKRSCPGVADLVWGLKRLLACFQRSKKIVGIQRFSYFWRNKDCWCPTIFLSNDFFKDFLNDFFLHNDFFKDFLRTCFCTFFQQFE